jgi:hypothetical protein
MNRCLMLSNINSCIYDTVFYIIVLIEMGSTFLRMKTMISYSYRQPGILQFALVGEHGLDHPSGVSVRKRVQWLVCGTVIN